MTIAPLNVLIVEDEALIAMDIEAAVEDAGNRVVGEAHSLSSVEALAGQAAPDLAFVDLNLADGSNGLDVCRFIREHWAATIVVFVTANPAKIPRNFEGAHGHIEKPFSHAGLISAMRYIAEGVKDPPPRSEVPASFLAYPAFAAIWL